MKSSRMRTPLRPAQYAPKTPKSRPNSNNNLVKDPVQVFCRIRPLQSEADLSCVKVISNATLALIPPETAINYKISNTKETQYVFKHVFDSRSTQHEVYSTVAKPLVENLLKGKNGLLFSYGVTGSGKTYTMTGNIHNRGIMPRCLDVLFRTISDYQAKKYVFKPDRLNGFDILSEADAMLERQAEMNAPGGRLDHRDTDIEIASKASTDESVLSGIDEDNIFAVFITYVEIYNNSVYDLLEQPPHQKSLQSKIIREDSAHNMFVHGVTEIEVKSVEEALDAFHIGQKRKRMGHTILNSESSRSHSVFTIRLVQAPVDNQGEYVVQDRNHMTISQLSLVDLAGSERTNRTKNTGQRLREAGNINNSLMTLRTCLEILRENQMTGQYKKVPYRDSKLTHLFKNYFDGEGHVKMVVCINPRAEDYDENSHVMKFAEITQEVQIARPTPLKSGLDFGLTPGRRKANALFKIAMENLEEQGISEAKDLEIDLSLVYKLPAFPDFHLHQNNLDEIIQQLMTCLEHRIRTRKRLLTDSEARQLNVRQMIYEMETENIRLKTENAAVVATLNQEREKTKAFESKIVRYELSIDSLNKTVRDKDELIQRLERELADKGKLLSKKEHENEKQRKKFNTKLHVEADKMNRELELKLIEQQRKMQEKMRIKDEKLKMVTDIVNRDDCVSNLVQHFNNQENLRSNQNTLTAPKTAERASRPKGVPVANIRHRRSKSCGTDGWLQHKQVNPVPLGTVLQPYYKTTKCVDKLTDIKDINNSKTSKYCLITQENDTDGELETKLYKGDVIPTVSGGCQIQFTDVECLKQLSPTGTPAKKRRSSSDPFESTSRTLPDVASRCSIGIEGHHSASKKQRI